MLESLGACEMIISFDIRLDTGFVEPSQCVRHPLATFGAYSLSGPRRRPATRYRHSGSGASSVRIGKTRRARQRVLKGASILTGVKNSEIKCAARNMNKTGAELKVAIDARVPQEFELYVPVDGIAYRAVVRWRKERGPGGGRIHRHRAQTNLHYG
jgi:hypothetical protein